MMSFGFYRDIEGDSVLLIAIQPSKIVNATQYLPIYVLSLNTFNEEHFCSDKTPTQNFRKALGTKSELACDPHTHVPHWTHFKTPITDLKTLISLLKNPHYDLINKRMRFRERRPENVFELVFVAIDRALSWKFPERPQNMWIYKTHGFVHTGERPLEFEFFKGTTYLSFVFRHDTTNCVVIKGQVHDGDPNMVITKQFKRQRSEMEKKVFKYFVDEKHFEMAEFVNEDVSLYVKDHHEIFELIDVETFFMCVGFFGSQGFSNYPHNVPSNSDINIILNVK